MEKVLAIIVAAGSSSRMKSGNKIFLELGGKSVLGRTMEIFQNTELCDGIIIVTKAEYIGEVEKITQKYGISKFKTVVEGGKTRAESVLNGIAAADGEYLLIHDGARPLCSLSLVEKIIAEVKEYGAVIPAVPIKDTVKVIKDGFVESTPDRSTLFAVQTPQGFSKTLYLNALEVFEGDKDTLTDDSMLFESAGYRVKTVLGEYTNIKITTDEDIAVAERFLREI